MLPLNGVHVLEHDVRRILSAQMVDDVVVATSEKNQDDIIVRYAKRAGASVYRGSETDVLARMYNAADDLGADVVVRATADNPLISPKFIDEAVTRIIADGFDYVSGSLDRSFPRGISSEVFTFDSFREVEAKSDDQQFREHVTPYYYKNPDKFDLFNLTSKDIFDEKYLHDRTELRLTLDEANDYELLRRIYEGVEYEEIVDIAKAIQFIDDNRLSKINEDVSQKIV